MKIENLKRIVVLLLVVVMILPLSSFAATTGSFTTSITSKEISEGGSTTVTVTTTNCAGQFTITSSDSSVASVDKTSIWVEGTESFTITAKSDGTAKIYVIASDVADNQTPSEEVTGTRTISITVPEPEKPDEPETPTTPEQPSEPEQPTTPEEPEKPSEPETPPTEKPETPEQPQEPEKPEEPEKPTVIEPNFTATNKTMYANGNINLRDSWTTSSNATRIEEGTELTVTATSTNTVFGYVWYRVSYNGQTKYVAGYLLTDKKPEEEKSNNANLKSLTVEGQELLPEFSSDVTSYSMNVTTDVDKLEIKAEAEDKKATVDIKGNTELKDRDNTVTISVSAEDGTVKIYEIKVTRADEIPLGLKTLKIEGTDIHKTFKADVFEYEIEVEELEGLKIEAIANDEKATVEILESVEGDVNNITIMVKSEDGEETVTYQVTAKKVVVVTEEPEKETTDPQIFIYIGIIVVAGAALIGVLVYFIKNRNTQKIYYAHSDYEDEEDFEGFPEELPEKKIFEDEDNNSDPFRRRGKHF